MLIQQNQFIKLQYYLNNQMKSQLQALDHICYECIHSNDRIKKQIQQNFMSNFSKSVSIQNLLKILDLASQNTLFVVTRYMEKNLDHYQDYQSLYIIFVNKLICWYSQNNLFIRNNISIEYHVLNTYTSLLGQIMKRIYKQYDKRIWLIQTINTHPNKFLLYQWKYFIQAVSAIDNQMGFLSYRTLINNFQSHALPQSMNIVVIFLKQLTQSIKMNQLTDLQQKLSIQQNMTVQENKVFKCSKQEQYLIQNSMKLLETILHFPFNITYSQYDMDIPNQDHIAFPDELVNKFTEGEFYESLYFLVQRLMLEKTEPEQMIILCIKSLQQIVLCKLSHIQKKKRKKFRQISLKKINKLMNFFVSNKILKELIELNIKIITNLQMHKFRKFQPTFKEWLKRSFSRINYTFQTNQLSLENVQINQSFELLSKIVCNSSNQKLSAYKQLIKEQSNKYLNFLFENMFIYNLDITKGIQIRSVKQIKKIVSSFFTTIKLLISLNFEQNLNYLAEVQSILFSPDVLNGNYSFKLTNFYFVMIQLCTNGFHQKNLYLERPNESALVTFGKIINNSFQFSKNYSTFKKNDYFILETAILLFHERVLLDCLTGIQVIGGNQEDTYKIISTNKLFNIAQFIPKQESVLPFLNQSFKIILSQIWYKDLRRINYSLDIINNSIWKLKWSMRRSILSELGLLNQLQSNCYKLIHQNYFTNQLIKCRINLMKIITMIGFDDCLDNYTHSLDYAFKVLGVKDSDSQVNYVNLMYDLRGIASQIDSCQIYPYFLRNIKESLKKLHKQLYQKGDYTIIKKTLKLDRTILQNKSQRFMKSKIIPQICEIVSDSMYYWTRLLVQLNNYALQQKNVSLGLQIYRIISQILTGNYLNIYLVIQNKMGEFESFIESLLSYSIKVIKEILFFHPKLLEIFCSSMLLFVRQYSEIIFSNKNTQFISLYSYFYQEIMKFCFKFLVQFDKSNKIYQQNIIKLCEITHQIFNFIQKSLIRIHKLQTFTNSSYFKSINVQINFQFVIELFKLTFKCWKNKTVFDHICKTIFKIVKLHSDNKQKQILIENFSNNFANQTQLIQMIYTKKNQNQEDYNVFSDKVLEWIKNQNNKSFLKNYE